MVSCSECVQRALQLMYGDVCKVCWHSEDALTKTAFSQKWEKKKKAECQAECHCRHQVTVGDILKKKRERWYHWPAALPVAHVALSTSWGRIAVADYYRKRGSASYIVREWLLWEGERERERRLWRHSISCWNREVIMHMIISTARWPNASTRSEPVECSCIRQGAWCLSARAAGNGRVIYEWRWEV